MRIAILALLLAVGWPAGAGAQEVPPALQPRPAAMGAAIFPGVLVHGAGHFVAGERRTAWRLLALEGVGAGLTVAGLGVLAATGASRHLAAPIFALPVAGVGLFATSWLADLYGVSAVGAGGAPGLFTPTVEARLGTRYVYDPTVRYGWLVGPAADLRWGRWRLSPGAWIAGDAHNVRAGAELAYRASGPGPAAAGVDGSYVDAVVAATEHHFGPEAFDLTILTAEARGRVDLRRLARTLAGSFAEGGLGLGWVLTHYRVGAHETDGDGLLLARFAYGLYLGRDPARGGELAVFYDHRHDDYAGGLKVTGIGSGVAGHLGLEGSWFFLPRWGLRAEGQVGSAYLVGLSLVHRARRREGGS